MRVLAVTKIFPSGREPLLAPYNRHQLRELSKLCEVVLFGLVPYYPGRRWLDERHVEVAPRETIDGVDVVHPRVFYVPRVGRALAGLTYTASLLPHVWAMRGRVDVVLGAFAYPDGLSALLTSRLLGVPCVVKLHGSDVNRNAADPWLRAPTAWTVANADAVVAPSDSLLARAAELGAERRRLVLVKNGIDKETFRVRDRHACRLELGCPGDERRWVLFVGNHEREKGLDELLVAFKRLHDRDPAHALLLAGDGRERSRYEREARDLRLPVTFVGEVRPERVATLMGASDVVVLPSYAEGAPNVVVEALACGRRVVASSVGAVPAMLHSEQLGELVPPRDADALTHALLRVLAAAGDPEAIAAHGGGQTWAESARALHFVLERAVSERRAGREVARSAEGGLA